MRYSSHPPESTSDRSLAADGSKLGRWRSSRKPFLRSATALLMAAMFTTTVVNIPTLTATAAPVGQGFVITPSDLAFILKQIKIAEHHVTTATATDICAGLLGSGPDQVPTPLTSYGLRTVDGSCNNLQPAREKFGASDQLMPRLAAPNFRAAEMGTSYASNSVTVVDSEPRVISNIIVDQTSTNPAAVLVAGAGRRGGGGGVLPCLQTPPENTTCTPAGQTLTMPNITTDVGLSPPYNSLFTVFGQFFDHGLDFTDKTEDVVYMPLKADDPLYNSVPPVLRFMALDRTKNQPGPDGMIGTSDDIKEAINRDSPYVDLSQNYASHPAHQVYLREYAMDTLNHPVSTGKLFGSADEAMPTWAEVKDQARTKLGLDLIDADVFNIPQLLVDPYGKFVPGPISGLPQFVTGHGLVEGDLTTPVAAPGDVVRLSTAFLNDIAHSAKPSGGKSPDVDTTLGLTGSRAAFYDNEMLDAHFIAGDGRINENIGLTAIHTIFHSEHDRLVADIQNILTADTTGITTLADWQISAANGGGANGWNGERLFQAAKFITEMEYQHGVFEEFGRKIQPLIQPFSVYHDNINSHINAEFASSVYRFGHSMLTDTIPRIDESGTHVDMALFDAFLNPPAFKNNGAWTARQGSGAIIMGMSDEVGEELDEFVADTLRNKLVGLPLDLATLNIARGRDAGLPRLNPFRRAINAQNNDASMAPYSSWLDFGDNLKNPASLVNFIAAYGKHPSILNETTVVGKRIAAQIIVNPPNDTDPLMIPADAFDFFTSTGAWSAQGATGLEDIDMWVGGLAEKTNLFGGLLGSTFNYVFERQMTDLQNGDRLYYLARTPGLNLRTQLEGNSFAELFMRNSTARNLKADSFGTADCKFDLNVITFGSGSAVNDDPASECDESKLLQHVPVAGGGFEVRYKTSNNGVDPVGINGQSVYNGKPVDDRIRGGVDNDTFLGNDGPDRIEGNDGADVAIGGDGNDIITDLAGDDVPKGGPGNDAIDSGPGIDIIMAGTGDDFTNGGLNDNETFAGDGNDKVIAGVGNDVVFGDSGSDWIQGGDGQDLLCGDSCAPFFDDPNTPGDDVLIGQNGEEDYDAEGGDDILVAGPGIERNAGAAGYDWVTHQGDPIAANDDLNLALGGVGLPAGVQRDRYQEVEALSGANLGDILRGDSVVPITVGVAGGFTGRDWINQHSLNIVSGLSDLLPAADLATVQGGGNWGAGNIILGGGGSDLIEGRGANDIIHGDKYMHVRLSVRTTANDPASEIGTTELMENTFQDGNPKTLQQAVFAGEIDPGNIVIVREILSTPDGAGNVDTAVFSGLRSDYTFTLPGNNSTAFTITDNGHVANATLVPPLAARAATDGTDTLQFIECLQFADVRVAVTLACNKAPTGIVTITPNAVVTEGQTLTAANTIVDPDGITSAIVYNWQANISGTAWTPLGVGTTFVPNNVSVGAPLRVVATYTDGLGFTEAVTSAATTPVINVNDPATGAPALSTLAPQEGFVLTASIGTVADLDGLPAPTAITYQWLANGADIAGATGDTIDPVGHTGETLAVRVDFIDDHGTAEQRISATTAAVLAAPELPAAPAIPTAVSGGFGSVTVSWTAPFDGRSAILNYDVEVLDGAGTPVPGQALRTVSGATTSVLVTGLTPGSYQFRVQATNGVGTGAWSSPSATVIPQDVPGAPVIGTATGGASTATANWAAPTSDGGSPVTGYIVRVFDSLNAQVGADRPAAATATSLAVAPLIAGSYTFQVLAKNIHGTGAASAASTAVTVTTLVLTAPTAPAATGVSRASTTITLAWTPPVSNGGSPITGYLVRVRNTSTGVQVGALRPAAATATSLVVTGLTNGTFYTLQVQAVNAIGTSPLSNDSASIRPATLPGAPLILGVTRGATGAPITATVFWVPVGNGGEPITGYIVTAQQQTGGGVNVGAPIVSAVLPANLLSYTATLTATNHVFRVQAINAVGTGPQSAASARVVPR
jgi:Animal haem peroxidase/Fibronectin type III domain/RTX calcium-binding nonapeptide repeat (4 copies)